MRSSSSGDTATLPCACRSARCLIGREDAFVDEMTIETKLHVAGALNSFKNHFVHPRARVDQRRGNDRQRSAFLDIARRPKESLRLWQRVGVNAARQDLPSAVQRV